MRSIAMRNVPLRFLIGALLGGCLALTLLPGCGHGNAPVRVEVAQETLASVLDSWKSGLSPDDVRAATPSVVVQDLDWSGGARLVDFEILPNPLAQDANLIAKVRLTLEESDGKPREKQVAYMVGTDPVLTVFRHMLP
ncbi:MAG: hypothetical protein KF774_12945 [Planctomyces sp.]|nr:hypothetical protein [Planctomyces sp.]